MPPIFTKRGLQFTFTASCLCAPGGLQDATVLAPGQRAAPAPGFWVGYKVWGQGCAADCQEAAAIQGVGEIALVPDWGPGVWHGLWPLTAEAGCWLMVDHDLQGDSRPHAGGRSGSCIRFGSSLRLLNPGRRLHWPLCCQDCRSSGCPDQGQTSAATPWLLTKQH